MFRTISEDGDQEVICDQCQGQICEGNDYRGADSGDIISGFCEIEVKGKGKKHFCSKDCFRLHMIKNLFKDPLLFTDSAGNILCGEDPLLFTDSAGNILCGEGRCNNKAEFLVDCDGGHELKYCKDHVEEIGGLTGITKITKIIH